MTKVSLSKTRCPMVDGLMVFPFVFSPWYFGPKIIDKAVYHENGTLSVARDSQLRSSSLIRGSLDASPTFAPSARIDDTSNRRRLVFSLYSICSQDLSIKRYIFRPLIGPLPQEPKSHHKQRQPSNHEARIIHRRRRNRQRKRKAEDNDERDDVQTSHSIDNEPN